MLTSRSRFSIAAVTMAVLLAACSSSTNNSAPGGDTPTDGGNVVDLQNFAAGDPDHIDPALASDVQSSQIAALVYDGLTSTTPQGEVKNDVAESATANSDATVWTFRIRNSVKFDNNDPVRPSDFKFAWERAADPKLDSKVAYLLSNIMGFGDVQKGNSKQLTGVVADDQAGTLTVTLATPQRDFAAQVSLPIFSPLPKKVFDATSGSTQGDVYQSWENGVMVGDGPFRMAKPWEKGRGITLTRSDTYYGGPDNHHAHLETLEFRISQGLDSAFTDFESGDGQVGRIPPTRFADLQKQRPDDIVNNQLMGVEFWSFNMKDPQVGGPDNLKLRQAIALATDKRDLVGKVYGGARTVATGFAPPSTPGFQQSTASPDANKDRAMQLLREWGKTPPLLRITFNAGAGHEEKAAILQQNLKDVGITATPDPLDNQAYRKAVGTGSVQLFRQNWNADYVSYDSMLVPNFLTTSIGSDNVSNYSNPKFDDLVKSARGESDPAKRVADYRDAEKLVLDDQVVIPLDWTSAGLIKAPAVRGLTVSPLGRVDYTDVWVKR